MMRVEEGVELAQAVIQLGDVVLQGNFRREERGWRAQEQAWRVEDRAWRKEDVDWREREATFIRRLRAHYRFDGKDSNRESFVKSLHETQKRMGTQPPPLPGHNRCCIAWQQQQEWRIKDLQQRSLDNARVLWNRFVEKNRRDVEERAEQLKSVGNNSALIAGFAVVAFLEFQVEWDQVPLWLEVLFAMTTALVVGLNAQAMVATSLMHASILKSGKAYVSEEAEAEYMQKCLAFETRYQLGSSPPGPTRTFAQHWETRCEADWQWAFALFSSGLVAFIGNLVIAAWIKFRRSTITPVVVTATLGLCMLGMMVSISSWAPHLFQGKTSAMHSEAMLLAEGDIALGLPFDWHRVPEVSLQPSVGMPETQAEVLSDQSFHEVDSDGTQSHVGLDDQMEWPPDTVVNL